MSRMGSQIMFTPPRSGMSLEELISHMQGEMSKMNAMKTDFMRSAQSGLPTLVQNIVSGSGGGGSSSGKTIEYHCQTVAVATTGTAVSFPQKLSNSFGFGILQCVDTNGNTIGCKITNLTSSGFTATSVRAASLTYFVVVYN